MTLPARPVPAPPSGPSRRGLPGALRAFRHRNYRLFFAGQALSLVGTWMQGLAQGWLVLSLTDEPFLLGLTAAFQWGPVLVLGLFGGLVADVLPRRATLVAVQATQMGLALLLWALVASGAVALWHVLAIAAALGATNAVELPTRQAFAIEMVGREDVPNAVALNSAMFNGARIAGPALAGLAIGAFGLATAFLLNAASFVFVIGAYLLMRPGELVPAPRMARPTTLRAVGTTLAEGLRYVRRTPVVLLATVTVGLVSTLGMNFSTLMPPYARDVLGLDATGFGFLMAAFGVGSMGAALGLAAGARTRRVLIPAGAVVLGAGEILAALTDAPPLALLIVPFVGAGGIAMGATGNTVIQLAVPDALRGRVMSVYTTVFVGATPIGGLAMGAVASSLGVPAALASGGAASALVGVGAYLGLRRLRAREAAAG